MRALILAAVMAAIPSLSHAEGGFPTLAKFEAMSVSQMAKLPDVRVPMCRKLSAHGLSGKSKLELSLMKNSIFAQTGYHFQNAAYRNYFLSRPWYKNLKPAKICAVDKENAQMLSNLAAKARDHATKGGGDNGYGGYGDDNGYGYGEEPSEEDGGYNGGYDDNGYGGSSAR